MPQDRAVYFLRAKDRSRIPTPFLVTHSLLNDPSIPESTKPYVPLGPTDTIEDPRLVRIGNYEDGVTGRHHAARVLEPFIASIASGRERRRVAVLLSDTSSLNKVTQTLLIVAIFVPFSYFIDRLFYRSHLRRRARGEQAAGRRGS